MTRNVFNNYICESIRKGLAGEIKEDEIFLKEEKGDSHPFTCLLIASETRHLNVSIHLDSMYDDYLTGISIQRILALLLYRLRAMLKALKGINLDSTPPFETVKDHLRIRVLSKETVKTLQGNRVYLERDHYTVAFYMEYESDQGDNVMIPVLTNHLSDWGRSVDDLMSFALKRQLEIGVLMVPLEKASADPAEMKENSIFDQESADLPKDCRPLFCLTQDGCELGAALIENKEVLQRAYELLGRNYYIIPSSVHELIIFPDTVPINEKELCRMIRAVNMQDVREEERVCDLAYYYDGKNGRISNVIDYIPEWEKMLFPEKAVFIRTSFEPEFT